jgi:hypothetical protein
MKEIIMLNIVCLVLALGALGVAVWAVLSGQLFETGVDGLFLVLVCLLLAVIFSIIPLQAIRKGLLRELLRQRQPKTSEKAGEQEEQKETSAFRPQPSDQKN